jgi:hypothetical protein
MSHDGAAPRAAVRMSSARAEASRRNGAKSRGPNTPAGKARPAQNALKHGLRAQKHLVLPDEDGAEFADLEAALVVELAPVGALQTVLARRVPVAAGRLARADRIEIELFAERRSAVGGLGLALIRDGNGARSFETLLRYRGAAMAEFWRALKTLKALQAEQPAVGDMSAEGYPAAERTAFPPPARMARRPIPGRPAARQNTDEPRPPTRPDEPERAAPRRLEYVLVEPSISDCMLHEPAALWLPNEPENGRAGSTGVRGAASARLP